MRDRAPPAGRARTTFPGSSRGRLSARHGAFRGPPNRRDFSVEPPRRRCSMRSRSAGDQPRRGRQGRRSISRAVPSLLGIPAGTRRESSDRGVAGKGPDTGFLFGNLVDFDQLYGHRNDVPGFIGALREFDAALPALRRALREEDLLFITADHGNDPTTASSDHARENVPVLAIGPAVRPGVSIGRRATFADLGATISEWFGLGFRGVGSSFLGQILG